MGARHRTRSTLNSTGVSYAYFGSIELANDVITVNDTKSMYDVTGSPGIDHTLDSENVTFKINKLKGDLLINPDSAEFRLIRHLDCPPEYFKAVSLGHLNTDGPSADATTVLSRTNPSRPQFNLPAFIGELRDLPHMFKIAGDTLLRKGANAFLSYQFGWKPLISDMSKALDFSSQFRSRADEFHRLHSNGGLKRRINLGSQTAQAGPGLVTIHSSNGLVTAKQMVITTAKSWATVRWLPDRDELPPTTKADSERYARALLGTGVSGLIAGAWQLMPWSWMVDWFGNVGDYLQATNNTIKATPGVVNIMTTTTTNHEFTVDYRDPWIKGGDCSATVRSLKRVQGSGPSLKATLPNLSGRQLSILGALGIQRVPRRLLR